MKRILLSSPAKLNLFLKVNFKRKDGYHDLATIFERIDLCDRIRLSPNKAGRIRISCKNALVPKGPRNLAFKAAQMLKDNFKVKEGVNISILKHIPIAAGLGGGSSNAATVLLGLNRLWKLGLTKKKLLDYAKRLGSDVPFFIYGASWALGTGRGDRIKPLFLPLKLWHILIVLKRKVYTKQIFGALNLRLTKKNADVNILRRALEKSDLARIGRLLFNDLEAPILRSHPNLLKIKEKLQSLRPEAVSFSGSGPSIFALAKSQKDAYCLKRVLKKTYSQVFVVRTF